MDPDWRFDPAGDRLTRDYLQGFPPSIARSLVLQLIWGVAHEVASGAEVHAGATASVGVPIPTVYPPPPPSPLPEDEGGTLTFPLCEASRKLLVFTDMPVLKEHLGLPGFSFTDDVRGEGAMRMAPEPLSTLCGGSL